MSKSIEFIVGSRNDTHFGNPMERLHTSLSHNLKILDDKDNWRFTIVDWGSDVPIKDKLKIKHRNLRYIYVPKDVCETVPTSFSEVHCQNVGAFRSDKDYVSRIDQDTMMGHKFVKWFFDDHSYVDNTFYFNRRFDLYAGIDFINGPGKPSSPVDWPAFLCDTGIFLVPREAWHSATGYDEKNIFRNHMEHEFIFRLNQKLNFEDLTKQVGYDFFHVYHIKTVSGYKYNRQLSPGELKSLPFVANDIDDWGLQKFNDSIEITEFKDE